MPALGIALRVVGAVLGVLLGVGGIAYAVDYGVEATVVERKCSGGGGVLGSGGGSGQATVRAKLVPTMTHTVTDLSASVCNALREGNYVVYHIRTGRTVLYSHEGGACMYDSATRAACGS